MILLFFIVLIIIAVVIWAVTSSGSSDEKTNSEENGYARGYWEGYRAFGQAVQESIDTNQIDAAALQKLVDSGINGPDPALQSEPHLESIKDPEVLGDNRDSALGVNQDSGRQIAANDERRSLRNMNALLYMASFLLVAAGAAFIAAAVPDSAKLFGLWLIVFAFYVVGLYLHTAQPKLRPAAVAFTGTGLALLPFAGIALDQYTAIGATGAWLVTSLLGLAAYAVAALRLQNQVVSYLTLAFVLSVASSSVAIAALPMFWYFVAVIGVSLLANMVSVAYPRWLPKIFSEPIERTGQIVTPIALIASLVLFDRLQITDYQIVFSVATAHYLVVWLQTRMYLFEAIARALLHVTLLIIAWDIVNGDAVQFGVVYLILAVLQLAYSHVLVAMNSERKQFEMPWIVTALAVQLTSVAFWQGSESIHQLTLFNLVVVFCSSSIAAVFLRRSVLGIAGLIALIIVPFTVGRELVQPPLDWGWIAAYFIALSAVFLGLYYSWARRHSAEAQLFVSAASIALMVIAGVIGVILQPSVQSIVFACVTVLLLTASYVIKQPVLTAFSVGTLVVTVWSGMSAVDIATEWMTITTAIIAGGIVYAYQWLTVAEADRDRQQILLVATWIVIGFGGVLELFASDVGVRIVAALLIVTAASTAAVEAYRLKNARYAEIAAYVATFGLQRLVSIAWPELNVVFYAHWWALSVAAAAYMRRQFVPRAIIAMTIITVITASYALINGGGYSLLFLIEHLALLVAGFVYSKSWAVWWGVIASSMAVLYFLRDIAFLAFAFLGILLIGIVIWRLSRTNKTDES